MSNDSVPEVLGFDHAGLPVSDLERSHQFYADVFGFNRVEDEFRMPDHELRGRVLVNPAGIRIELFAQRGSQPRKRLDPTVGAMQRGWFQFALSTKDIKASYARVVAAGAAPLMPPGLLPTAVRCLPLWVTLTATWSSSCSGARPPERCGSEGDASRKWRAGRGPFLAAH